MRAIRKGKEPASLVLHRATPGADYDGYRDKDTLRACLVREQRGLCCYCLSPIRAERGRMKIEHWHSQEHHDTQQLDYSNLLAACMGNEGQPRDVQHCDTRKGDRDLSRNPANPMHRIEDFIRFLTDGRIGSNDPTFQTDLDDVLNLNTPFLVNRRIGVLNGFKESLEKRGGSPDRRVLKRLLDHWNGESETGDLQPYCQVVVYYLRKRLARAR